MSRIIYVNGRYVPHQHAMVHVEDRGYQFADGVYEVLEVRWGRLLDSTRHLARLARSLNALRIQLPMPEAALRIVIAEVIGRNKLVDGIVYLQVTRGVARRDHAFPVQSVRPSLVITTKPIDWSMRALRLEAGVRVVTVPDNRWERVDIKSIALLPNVLAKQAAREQGAFEAWFVGQDGLITEGSSSNAWIITREGVLITASGKDRILSGVTRSMVLDVVERNGLRLEQRAFSREEAMDASEAFITSRTASITPVIEVDGIQIGEGSPGPVTRELALSVLRASEGLDKMETNS